jgi:hypothetical protein
LPAQRIPGQLERVSFEKKITRSIGPATFSAFFAIWVGGCNLEKLWAVGARLGSGVGPEKIADNFRLSPNEIYRPLAS